jgi:hypothetical protein
VTTAIGKLAPGTYTLKGKWTTKLYSVTVKIGGTTTKVDAFKTNEVYNINFTLTKETDVKLEMSSDGGTVSGAEFTLAEAAVNIDVDFANAKNTLLTKANQVKGKITSTEYAKQEADLKTIENIIKEINGIKEEYNSYKSFGLYDLENGAEAKKISELLNLVVYEQVNEAIAAVKAVYNEAVTTLEGELTGAAQYLMAEAQKELDVINTGITDASIASTNSWTGKTAAADEATNKALIPNATAIENIVSDYKTQATSNKNAYKALGDVLSGLKKEFSDVKDNQAASKEKAAADNAIKALEAIINGAYNTKAQLTLTADDKYVKALNDAKAKLNDYKKAAANANQIDANAAAISKLQQKFNKAKEDASAKKSEDGKYSANGSYYTDYLKSIQTKIDNLTKANKVSGGSVAVTDTKPVESEIDNFLKQATAAVDYYDVLQRAIADYNAQLETVRADVEDMPIYNDEEFSDGKNYKYELDLLLKTINEIQGAINEALKKKGEAHWTAMLAIDKKGDTSFASVDELNGQAFAIVNAEDGKAIYGTNLQNLGYDTFDNAFVSTNSGYLFKIEESTVKGAYRLRMLTPADEEYSVWGSPGYLNSQPQDGKQQVSFILGLKDQEGQDAKNCAAWIIEYVAGKGFTLKNVGTGKYLKDNTWAMYDEPTYFNFRTVEAYLAGTSIPDQIQQLQDDKVAKQAEYDQKVFDRDNTALNTAIAKFEQDYKPATNEKIEMAHQPINDEFEAIKTAVSDIPTENVNATDKVGTGLSNWLCGVTRTGGNYQNKPKGDNRPVDMIEVWAPNASAIGNGNVLYQTVNVPNGTYTVEIYAQANGGTQGVTDAISIYANDVSKPMTTKNDEVYTIKLENVEVTDGKLEMGMRKAKEGTNWHLIQIKSLTLTGGSALLVKRTGDLAEQKAKLEALEGQAKAAQAADKAKADLKAKVDAKKKEYADSKDPDVQAAGAAQGANFDNIVTLFNNFLNDANGDVQKALKDLKLEPNNYKAKLDELNKRVNDVAAAADINAQIAKVDAAATKAKADIVADATGDPNAAGNKFYLDKFGDKGEIGKLLLEYKKTAGDAEAAIFNDKKTDADRSAAKKAGLIEQLKALQTKIEGLAKLANDNLKSYTAQHTLAGEVQDKWNEVYLQIASTDESSARDEYLGTLDEIQKTLTEKANIVEDSYKKGASVAKDQTTDLNTIKKQIEDLLKVQQEGYNEQIAADNAAQYAAIGEAVKAAQEAYTSATKTYEEYNAAESDLLKNAIEKVKTEKDNLVDAIKNFPTEIAKLQEEIGKAYQKVTSPDVFDKDGEEWEKQVVEQQAKMEQAEQDFLDKVKAAAESDCKALIANYKSQRDAAANIVKTYGKKNKTADELNTIFKEIDNLISDIETAMSAPKLVELDQALKAAESIPDKIAAVKEAQVDAYLGTVLADIMANKSLLSATDQTAADNEKKAYDSDKKKKKLAANYATHKTTILALAEKMEKAKLELLNYDAITANFDKVQKAIDDAKAEADNYLGGQTVIGAGLENIQNQLDVHKDNLEADKANGTVTTDKTVYDNFVKKALDTDIPNELTVALYDAEIDAIDNLVNTDIEAQYVLFANDFEENVQEQAAAYKKQIDAIKKKLADAKKVADKNKKPSDLKALEDEVTALLTELSNANNPAGQSTVYDKLFAAADALNSNVDKDVTKFTEAEQKDIADQQADIDKSIDDLKALIEDKKDKIVAFEGSIQQKIEAIKADITALQQTVNEAQKALDAKIAAAKALADGANKTISETQKLIDEAKAEIDGYAYTSAEDFKAKFDKLQQNLNDKQDAINAKAEDGSLKQEDVDGVADLKDEIMATITDVKNTAANRELLGELADLKAQFKDISVNEDDFTLGDLATINAQLEAIEDAIGDDTAGLEKDIADAKTNSKSYESLGTEEAPGVLQKKVDEIQKMIDDLNKFLEDNTLNPVEPEPEVIPGDITGTGEVTDADFDKFLEDLLNGNLPTEGDPNFAIYDANGDGFVDIADLQAILNLSNGLNWDGSQPDTPAGARSNASFEAGTMNVETVKLANGNTRLNIVLNSTADFRAFQMDLKLANGMSVAEENGNALTVRSNDLDAIHRIAGYGQVENNGTMLSIDVVGNGNVQFSNIVLTTASAKAVKFTLGETTGINTAMAEKDGNVIYDLGGRLMNGLKKGFGIIRGTNGTKKVVK